MPAPVLWGSRFQINTTNADAQYLPKIVALPNGTFVAVWNDISQTGSDTAGNAVRGQILNADGSKKGGEFLINEITYGDQSEPSIAVLSDGRFVVVWSDTSGHDGELGTGIWGRVYNMDGSEAGSPFHVNTPQRAGNQYNASVSATSNGGFIVTYTDDPGGAGSTTDILAQAYDANGQKFGPETRVNETTINNQATSKVIGLKEGRYAVFYLDGSNGGDDPTSRTIRGRIMKADGQPAEGTVEFVVPSSRGMKIDPAAVMLSDGRFVVAWRHINQNTGDGSGTCIKAQIYNADGTMFGGEFVVNTTTTNDQSRPVLAATIDGGFAVGFADVPDPVTRTISFRVATFGADGTRSGPDMVAAVDDSNTTSALTSLADGRLVLTWDGKTGSANATQEIWGQILDPRYKGVVVNGTGTDDHYVGTRYNDVLNGGAGADRLAGGYGNDVLNGSSGRDSFVFDAKPNSKSNKDSIRGWSYKEDTIYLENAIFKSLTKTGTLSKSSFVAASTAKDKNDFVGYNSKTGDLWYDSNGSKSGGQVVFANIGKGQKIFYNDFYMI